MSLFLWSLSRYQHSSKKAIAASLGGGHALVDAEDHATSALVIGYYPSATGSACIVSIASYKIQSVKHWVTDSVGGLQLKTQEIDS